MKFTWIRKKAILVIGVGTLIGAASLISSTAIDVQLFDSQAFAQGQGQGPGPGGNSAGGGPNNQGAAAGGQGTSTGPGSRNRARGGGGGGGLVPSAIGSDSALIGGGDKSAPTEITGSDWCAGYKADTATTSKRVTGQNLKRLDAARQLIAPEFDMGRVKERGFPLYNLAMYQEVLETDKPDTILAGTYLGLTANVPMTDSIVNRMNEILCVKGNTTTVQKTAAVAEEQRISMR